MLARKAVDDKRDDKRRNAGKSYYNVFHRVGNWRFTLGDRLLHTLRVHAEESVAAVFEDFPHGTRAHRRQRGDEKKARNVHVAASPAYHERRRNRATDESENSVRDHVPRLETVVKPKNRTHIDRESDVRRENITYGCGQPFFRYLPEQSGDRGHQRGTEQLKVRQGLYLFGSQRVGYGGDDGKKHRYEERTEIADDTFFHYFLLIWVDAIIIYRKSAFSQ